MPKRRYRSEEDEPEAVNSDRRPGGDQSAADGEKPTGPRGHLSKRRRKVRLDRAAEFLAACASGDTEETHEMLKEARETNKNNTGDEDGIEIINCANADGITALHQACIDGSMEMVSFLLGQGANVNQVDSEGWTPLHAAASCGNLDITDFLLQQGAALSAVNCDGDVPLDIADDDEH